MVLVTDMGRFSDVISRMHSKARRFLERQGEPRDIEAQTRICVIRIPSEYIVRRRSRLLLYTCINCTFDHVAPHLRLCRYT
jgi:hypothetical protein